MNAFQLKILAVVLMVIDHVGAMLNHIPSLEWLSVAMRIVGRLSFPIFAWLIATGCRNTRNMKKYLLRLFLFALISQVPFALAFGVSNYVGELNIFFTLAGGVLGIILYRRSESRAMGLGFIFLISVVAWFFNFDYSFYGIWTIALFYIYYDKLHRSLPYFLGLNLVMLGLSFADFYAAVKGVVTFGSGLVLTVIQPLSLIALFIIGSYDGELGPKRLKYFFYAFYPAHLLLLWGISRYFL